MSGDAAELIGVTDHALLRWLERVDGHDVAGLRKALALSIAPWLDQSRALGPVAFQVRQGDVTLVLRSGVLVTVLR